MNTDKRVNYGPAMENAVYLYCRTNGYEVSVGRIGKLECDFIVHKKFDYAYIQVAMTIMNSLETENREFHSLENITDGYPKYIVTRNDLIQHRNGIIHVNIASFMRDKRQF